MSATHYHLHGEDLHIQTEARTTTRQKTIVAVGQIRDHAKRIDEILTRSGLRTRLVSLKISVDTQGINRAFDDMRKAIAKLEPGFSASTSTARKFVDDPGPGTHSDACPATPEPGEVGTYCEGRR